MKRTYFRIIGVVCIVVLVAIFIVGKYTNGFKSLNKARYSSPSSQSTNFRYSDKSLFSAPSPTTLQTVNIGLNVKDLTQAQVFCNLIISKNAGRIISFNTHHDAHSNKREIYVFDVSLYDVQSVLTDLRSLGQVEYENTFSNRQFIDSGYAVNSQHSWNVISPNIDMNLLKQRRGNLLQRYAEQTNPQASKELENQIARLDQHIHYMELNVIARPTYIQQTTPMARITVTYTESNNSILESSGNILNGLLKATGIIVMTIINMVNGLITILGYLLPIVVWVLIISLGVFCIIKCL